MSLAENLSVMIFGGKKDSRLQEAEDEEERVVESLLAFDPREREDVSVHVDRCNSRQRYYMTTQRLMKRILETTDSKLDRSTRINVVMFVVIIGLMVATNPGTLPLLWKIFSFL